MSATDVAPDSAAEAAPRRPVALSVVLALHVLGGLAGIGKMVFLREELFAAHPRLTPGLYALAAACPPLSLLAVWGVWRWKRWGLPLCVLLALVVFGLDEYLGMPKLHQAIVLLLLCALLWSAKPVLRHLI